MPKGRHVLHKGSFSDVCFKKVKQIKPETKQKWIIDQLAARKLQEREKSSQERASVSVGNEKRSTFKIEIIIMNQKAIRLKMFRAIRTHSKALNRVRDTSWKWLKLTRCRLFKTSQLRQMRRRFQSSHSLWILYRFSMFPRKMKAWCINNSSALCRSASTFTVECQLMNTWMLFCGRQARSQGKINFAINYFAAWAMGK